MIPIIRLPTSAQEFFAPLTSVFSAHEAQQFTRYAFGLMVSDNKTITGINALFVHEPQDQSTLNRFLTHSTWSIDALHHDRLQLLKQHPATQIKASGIVAIDDTLNVHYGKAFEGIAHLFDTKEQQYVEAHNLVTSEYVDAVTDYPLEFRLYAHLDIPRAIAVAREHHITVEENSLAEWKPSQQRRWLLHQF